MDPERDFVLRQARFIDDNRRSITVVVNERGVCLPRALVTIDQDVCFGDLVDVVLPKWLAREKGLIDG